MTVTKVREAQPADIAGDDEKWFQQFLDFHRRALSQVEGLPGVKNAAWSYGLPLTGSQLTAAIRVNGLNSEKFKDDIHVPVRTVTPEYFDLVGLPLLAGRNFGPGDTYTNRCNIAIINQAMAQKYFAGTDPVGKIFHMAFRNSQAGINRPFVDAEIIGVADDSNDESLTRRAEPEFYMPFWQMPTRYQSLVVRTTGDPRAAIAGIQETLRSLDPAVVIENVRTFAQIRNDSIAPQLFAMRLLAGFAVATFALALIGIYGVVSLLVASRRQEMAIRMAVGAQRGNVLRLILGEGLQLVGVGVIAGGILALASTRMLRSLLFDVEPADPLTFTAVAVAFILVAAAACYFPARRATRVEPMEALRYE
jgi:putative ABC transport system permease protein